MTRGVAVALLTAAAIAGPASASGADADPVPPAIAAAVGAARRLLGGGDVPVVDSWRPVEHRGRPGLEVKGRVAGPDGAPRIRDIAVVDAATGQVVSLIWFPGASRRVAGEAILPMSEASVAADGLARRLFPAAALALDGIQRYRASGEESVYYDIGYSPEGEVRFPEPVVRLILDASSSSLFRFDIDPAWLEPPPPVVRRISARAAERVATVALRPPALEAVFREGARPAKVASEGLYFVRPNGWPSDPTPAPAETPRRLAWGISFAVAGAAPGAQGMLYVDVASGRVLGGAAGPPP